MALECFILTLVVALSPLNPFVAQEQESLSHARALYESADYEGALKALAEVDPHAGTPSQRQAVREYRALCLLALERTAELEQTIQEMIEADPFYRPAVELTPPRLLAAYDRLRRQRLPSLAQQRYLQAKMDLNEKRYAESSDGFEAVLRLAAKTDAEPDNAELQAIRTVAARDLEASRTAREQAMQRQARRVCQSSGEGVTPPVPIQQDIPRWRPATPTAHFEGELELLINEAGTVQDATVAVPIHPAYDQLLLQAARKWKYKPATKDGRPVSYCRVITIALAPQ